MEMTSSMFKVVNKLTRCYGAFRENLLINIVRAVSLGICYGIIEPLIYVETFPIMYRILYIAMFLLPFMNLDNIWIWLGDGTLSMLVQDIMFWLVTYQDPVSWSWYYPVIDHFPVWYIIGFPLVIILYYLAKKKPIKLKFKYEKRV